MENIVFSEELRSGKRTGGRFHLSRTGVPNLYGWCPRRGGGEEEGNWPMQVVVSPLLMQVELHAHTGLPLASRAAHMPVHMHQPTAHTAHFRTGHSTVVGHGLVLGNPGLSAFLSSHEQSSSPPTRSVIFMSHAQERNLEGKMDKQAVEMHTKHSVLPHMHHLKGQPLVANNSISN